jgi:hypothetical protein
MGVMRRQMTSAALSGDLSSHPHPNPSPIKGEGLYCENPSKNPGTSPAGIGRPK